MTPSGKNILEILVNLLADQEGVIIKYELEGGVCYQARKETHPNPEANASKVEA